MAGLPYLDTSALAKWYLNERGSDEFERWVRGQSAAVISWLTKVEMRCLLARRRRAHDFGADIEEAAFSTFLDDLRSGFLRVVEAHAAHGPRALDLIQSLPDVPLRTLDALHLAIALHAECPMLATADVVLARAAERLSLIVVRFDSG